LALENTFSNVELADGPDIEEGFFYEFLGSKNVSTEHFSTLEVEMDKIIKQKKRFERMQVSR